jgi:hypothetical protein
VSRVLYDDGDAAEGDDMTMRDRDYGRCISACQEKERMGLDADRCAVCQIARLKEDREGLHSAMQTLLGALELTVTGKRQAEQTRDAAQAEATRQTLIARALAQDLEDAVKSRVAMEEQVAELSAWKANQQQFLIAASVEFMDTGYRGPGVLEGIRYLKTPVARPFSEWNEDLHSVLWWRFPIAEPPYVGQPNDSDWPFTPEEESALGWTRLTIPAAVPDTAAAR